MEFEELKKSSQEHANQAGIKLNPNEKVTDNILKALLRNKELKGELYCPCRPLTGTKERDDEIICPCVFHRGEIELQKHCHCNLFVE
tara:strand:- start:143 stop:403 length:261 start_codon:yes stop_codon:yes gene_type:complete